MKTWKSASVPARWGGELAKDIVRIWIATHSGDNAMVYIENEFEVKGWRSERTVKWVTLQ